MLWGAERGQGGHCAQPGLTLQYDRLSASASFPAARGAGRPCEDTSLSASNRAFQRQNPGDGGVGRGEGTVERLLCPVHLLWSPSRWERRQGSEGLCPGRGERTGGLRGTGPDPSSAPGRVPLHISLQGRQERGRGLVAVPANPRTDGLTDMTTVILKWLPEVTGYLPLEDKGLRG